MSQSSPWHEFVIPLNGYVDDTVQFLYRPTPNLSPIQWRNCRASLNDLSITEWDGSCRVPLDLRITSKGVANAVVEWRTLNPQSTYEVQYAQGNGVPSSGPTSITSGFYFNYSGLAANSTYTLRVRAICAPEIPRTGPRTLPSKRIVGSLKHLGKRILKEVVGAL